MTGTHGRAALVLVSTPIGNLGDLSPRAAEELRGADVIAAEDTRQTRKLLGLVQIAAGDRLRSVHAHNEQRESAHIVELIHAGKRVVLVTDAGTPAISDPGERIVRACVEAGLTVEVVPGPSAVLAALVVSGLPTTPFGFEGFLARKGAARTQRIGAMRLAQSTTILLESPMRVAATLAELRDALGTDRRAVVARELTKLHEEVQRGTLGELAEDFAARTLRGECVILVAPAGPAGPVDDEEIRAELTRAIAGGATRRDAAAHAAATLGVARRRAYELAVGLPAPVSTTEP